MFVVARPAAGQGVVRLSETATVFSAPTEQSSAIVTLSAGTELQTHATTLNDPAWVKVTLPGVFPRVGYVSTRFTAASHSSPIVIPPTLEQAKKIDPAAPGAVSTPEGRDIPSAPAADDHVGTPTLARITPDVVVAGTPIQVPIAAPPPAMPTRVATEAKSTTTFVVTLVDADLNLKAVPRHVLLIKQDGAEPIRIVTGSDGKATAELARGEHVAESERAIDFQGKSYRWSKRLIVTPQPATVELSVDSALVDRPASAARTAVDLPSLFKQWQGSVVTVWGETGRGTGFVIDRRGLILTNQHVVSNFDYAAVQLDGQTKLPATIVARSFERDIAILRVSPERLRGIEPVTLGFSTDEKAVVSEGEQVFTIGSPLHQRKVMTAGIVSKMEAHAIIFLER